MDLHSLSLEQKIAQMMVLAGREESLTKAMIKLGAGGIWPNGYPDRSQGHERFRTQLDQLQQMAAIGLLVSCDFETGCGQLIADGSCTEFPGLMALGAIAGASASSLAYQAGCIVAEEAAWLGVNITPSPVFDVNTVPENPICNTRSVGDNPVRVGEIAVSYALGMASRGTLLPQAKHFPGEGAHSQDPHLGLERMKVSREEMETIHLPPFRQAIAAGIPMIMTNHALYPPYDPDYPCTLSYKLITGLLREQMGFEGMVITDAMEMQGIEIKYGRDEALVLAINAGNDLILGPPEPQRFVDIAVQAVKQGKIKRVTIDRAVSRIMKYKRQLGLLARQPAPPAVASAKAERQALAQKIAELSMTLVRNEDHLIPLEPQTIRKALIIEPSHPHHNLAWGLQFNLYGLSDFFQKHHIENELMLFGAHPGKEEIQAMAAQAGRADAVFVSTFFRSQAGQTGLLTTEQIAMLRRLHEVNPRVVCVVSNPYVIAELPFARHILVTYGSNYTSVEAAVKVLLGELKAPGHLPVTLPESIDPAQVKIIAHD